MNERIEKIKTHFKDNKKVYIAVGTTFVVTAVSTFLVTQARGNTAVVDSFKLINYKSPHTSETIQIMLPRRGNSGNGVQCDQTGSVYPSQRYAAQELGINQRNLSEHLNGKLTDVNGLTFTKLTESGVPIA